MFKMTGKYWQFVAVCALSVFIGTGAAVADDDEGDVPAIFYPAPPNEPRLQFLKKFSSQLDVSSKSQGFRNFVFGGADKENQLVVKPYGLAMYEGALYVVDTRGFGYGVFDLDKGESRFVRPSGAGKLVKPINITIDEDGLRYVTDTARQQVLVFDSNDRYLKSFGEKGQFKPVDVAIIEERLYVTDTENNQVHVLDKRSGESLMTIGEGGNDEGKFLHPTNLAVGPDQTLYVTDTTNFRIQQFDKDGAFIRSMGSVGAGAGQFSRPKGVAVDNENNIYVVDSAFENVQILAPDGGARMAFGGPGNEKDDINLPTVVKIDYDNVQHFAEYVDPSFEVEYLVLVASQFGQNKVTVFGFGHLRD